MEKLYLPMALGRTGPMMYAYSLCMYGCTLNEGTHWGSSERFLAGEYGVPSGRSTLHSVEEYVCALMCIVLMLRALM